MAFILYYILLIEILFIVNYISKNHSKVTNKEEKQNG